MMRACILGFLWILSTTFGSPLAAQSTDPPAHDSFDFPSKPEVTIKLSKASSSRPVRGKLIRLTPVEVLIDTGTLSRRDRERGELGQRVELDRIETLRSTDGRFEFQGSDDYAAIAERVRKNFASARIVGETPNSLTLPAAPIPVLPGEASKPGVGVSVPGSVTKPQKNESPDNKKGTLEKPAKPAPKGIGTGGFGGMKNVQKSKKTEVEGVESEETDEAPPTGTDDSTQALATESTGGEAQEILFCSNCSKQIPATAIKSGVCPHCKIAFSNVTAPTPSPGTKPSANSPSLPSPGDAFATKGAPAPAGNAPPSTTASTGTVVVQGGGFSFDAIPNWAKGGLFILLVLVGYHLLFNR